MVRIRFFLFGALCFLLGSVALQAQQFTITSQQQVSAVRVSLYQFDYTYQITATNTGPAANAVTCVVTSTTPQTIIESGNLTFGNMPSGSSATSTTTLVFRQDRRYAFSWSNLQWQWSSTPAVGPGTGAWTPATSAITIFPGTQQLISLALTSSLSLTNVSLLASGTGASYATVFPATIALQANQPAYVSVTVQIPSGTTPTTLQLTLSAFFGSQKIASDANLTLNVVNPSGIPGTPATPSSDRIVQDASGTYVVQDQLIVMLDSATPDPATTITAIASQTGGIIVGSIPDLLYYQLQYPGMASSLPSIEATIESLPNVDGAVQEFLVELDQTPPTITFQGQPLPPLPADDPYFGDLWGLTAINAPTAWAVLQLPPLSPGFANVPLAIVDADLDFSQPDFFPNLNGFFNHLLANQGVGGGHGTVVAGIACARGNNGIGVTGATWDCDLRLYPFPLLVDGNKVEFSVMTVAQNMRQAVADGASIVNLSLGTTATSCTTAVPQGLALTSIQKKQGVYMGPIQSAGGQKVLWVISAGNTCSDALFTTPANLSLAFPNVITVAATDQDGNFAANFPTVIAEGSNYGEAVSIAAPGVGIFSTLPVNEVPPSSPPYGYFGGTLQEASGTSFAAPFVSGVAALVWSMHPDYTAQQVHDCIESGSLGENPVPGIPAGGGTFALINAAKATVCGALSLQPPNNNQWLSQNNVYIVNSASGTVQVPVPLTVTVVDLSGNPVQMNLPPDSVTWESSDPTVATVDMSPQCASQPQDSDLGTCFVLEPLAPGTVTITATSDVTFNNIPPGALPAFPSTPNSLTLTVQNMCVPSSAGPGSGSYGAYSGTYLSATYKEISGQTSGPINTGDGAYWGDTLLVVPTDKTPWGTPFDMMVGVTTLVTPHGESIWSVSMNSFYYYAQGCYPPGDCGNFVNYSLPCLGYGCGVDPWWGLYLGSPFAIGTDVVVGGPLNIDTTWNGIQNVINLNTGNPVSFQVYSCSGTQY